MVGRDVSKTKKQKDSRQKKLNKRGVGWMHILHLLLDRRTPHKIHILNNFEFENMLLSPSQPDCLVLDFAHLTNSKFMRGLLKKTKYCSQISLLPSNSKHYNTVKERYKVEIDEKTMR